MSATYTYSKARQNLASLLEKACQEGEVKIKRKDGVIFTIKPIVKKASPLDVKGVDLGLSANEIVKYIHEGRKDY